MPKLSIEEKLTRFSPITLRLLARTSVKGRRGNRGPNARALSTEEIVERSGLDPVTVATLSTAGNWDAVTVATMFAFMRGCGADLSDREWLRETRRIQQRFATRKGLPMYLRTSPEWLTVLQPLSVHQNFQK